ncbi:MAG: HAD family hydrolase [Candidatus Lokiarchaeota archaeon]|nr:HAD family hydrolase [Candidatus Lokiarchaeota archaeon]
MKNLVDVKVIVFDAMGVIFIDSDDIKDILLPYLKDLSNDKITLEDIRQWYFQLSRGDFESKKFWLKFFDPKAYPKVEFDYIKLLRIDPEFKEILPLIKNNYEIALLSNDVHEWSREWREYHDLEHVFDAIVVSGDPDVRVRKPNPLIYEKLINRFEYSPKNFIFIDDRLRNLKPASELGMITILMNRFPQNYPFKPDLKIRSLKDLLKII